jgi:hypothetical protein
VGTREERCARAVRKQLACLCGWLAGGRVAGGRVDGLTGDGSGFPFYIHVHGSCTSSLTFEIGAKERTAGVRPVFSVLSRSISRDFAHLGRCTEHKS